MHTILETSKGYSTACVIDVKGGGDKSVNSSAVSFLKELVYTRIRSRTDPEPAIKAPWMRSSSVCLMTAQSSKSCQRRQFPRVMRVRVRWRAGTISCKDKFKRFDTTSKSDLDQSSVLLINACRGL